MVYFCQNKIKYTVDTDILCFTSKNTKTMPGIRKLFACSVCVNKYVIKFQFILNFNSSIERLYTHFIRNNVATTFYTTTYFFMSGTPSMLEFKDIYKKLKRIKCKLTFSLSVAFFKLVWLLFVDKKSLHVCTRGRQGSTYVIVIQRKPLVTKELQGSETSQRVAALSNRLVTACFANT